MKVNKKILALILATSTVISVGGCSKESSSTQLDELNAKVTSLEADLNEANSKIDALEKLMPKKSTGEYTVIASALNIRQDASDELENIGTIKYGSKVNVIDTSNPLWFKVKLDTSSYDSKDEEYSKIFTKGANSLEVKKDFLDKANSEVYMSSKYLTNESISAPINVPTGKKPFVYGLLFFDDDSAKLLASEIWNTMQNELKSEGYTGVKVVPVNRDTYEKDMASGIYDAVESAPSQYADVDKENDKYSTFAKDIIDGTTSYRGIIIANKESGIKDFKDLKGKKILTGKEYSESGYQYQKYFLKEMENIDANKDLDLEMDNYHQETFYKVASGEADAGFCGDFVMTDKFGDMKFSLKLSGIDLKSKEELENLRNNIVVLNMDEMSPIPNNPHSLKNELYKNQSFVNKLYAATKKIYSNNKEGYDLTEANDKEYEMLAELEVE